MPPSLLAKAVVVNEPFPHVVVQNALPDDYYAELESKFIPCEWDDVHQRHDIKAVVLKRRNIPPIWEDFIDYHTSREFFHEAIDLFNYDIDRSLPIKLRGAHGKKDVSMDMQLSWNTKVLKAGSIRGPHIDDANQLFGGLFYMPEDGDNFGGDLILYRKIKELRLKSKAEIAPDCVEEVCRVPYKKNTLVFFQNSLDAIHGVSERQPTEINRRFLNMVITVPGKRFKSKSLYCSKEEWLGE